MKIFLATFIALAMGINSNAISQEGSKNKLSEKEPAAEVVFKELPRTCSTAADAKITSSEDQAEAWLDKMGVTTGYDPNRDLYISQATVAISSIQSRDADFEKALLSAKASLAEYLSAEIMTAAQSTTGDNSTIARNILDEINGVGIESGEKGEILLHNNFSSIVAVHASAAVSGMRTLCVFESSESATEGYMTIIASISKNSLMMAAALTGKGIGVSDESKKRESLKDWLSALKAEDDTLLYSQGVLQRYDENGELWLISFGQSTPKYKGIPELKMQARDMAATSAQGYIRTFAGENITSQKALAKCTSVTAYVDTEGEVNRDVEANDSFKKAIDSEGASLKLSGITLLGRASIRHPLSRVDTEIMVYQWSVSSFRNANATAAFIASGPEVPESPEEDASEKDTGAVSGSSQGQGAGSID